MAVETKPSVRWWPWVRRVVGVAIFTAGLLAAVDRRHQLVDASRRLGRLDMRWVLVAVLLEVASIVVMARLLRVLLWSGGVHLSARRILEITFAGTAMTLSLPGGGAVSAAWQFGQYRRRGADRVLGGWVVLMAGALSSFALFVVIAAGTVLAGGSGPVSSLRWLAVALAAIPLMALAVYAAVTWVPAVRDAASRWVTAAEAGDRWKRPLHSVRRAKAALRAVQPSPGDWAEASGLALLNWVADLGCLIAAVYAVGGAVPWRGILVAYGLARLAGTLPFTPGGLALVEGSLSALLIAYGMQADVAVAAVLLYRIVSFWGLVPLGWATYGWLTWSGAADVLDVTGDTAIDVRDSEPQDRVVTGHGMAGIA